ncbi:MAG: type II toxin-antitoxin system VapC family toxin [Pirellulales bacterium]|nr:type II toxin-antitoxin system VapC family toxin [Pirellulales bacterium]
MTTLVVDASVAAKWFFPEDYSAECRRLLAPQRNLLVPDLIWSEMGNIVWKRVRQGEVQPDEAARLIADFARMPLEVAPTQDLLPAAVELAIATDRTVYDCMYLALAIDRKCPVITADERFAHVLAATPWAKHVRHVAKARSRGRRSL